jgi:metallophosphoesterase superfamily enzyme
LPEWNIEEIDGSFEEDGVILSHAPLSDESQPVLAGHVHPVFALRDYDRTTVKTPCFVFDHRCAILPSFGSFTGGYRIDPQPDRKIYIIAGARVVAVNSTFSS